MTVGELRDILGQYNDLTEVKVFDINFGEYLVIQGVDDEETNICIIVSDE